MSGGVDISPTLQESTGLQLMREVALRRLYTPNQSLLSAPDEQTCDLRQFLSTDAMAQANGTLNTNTIRATAVAALKADARILSAQIEIEWFPATSYMTVAVKGTCADGPFELTLGVNAVTIKVLQQ
jgi:hypothetical protein